MRRAGRDEVCAGGNDWVEDERGWWEEEEGMGSSEGSDWRGGRGGGWEEPWRVGDGGELWVKVDDDIAPDGGLGDCGTAGQK